MGPLFFRRLCNCSPHQKALQVDSGHSPNPVAPAAPPGNVEKAFDFEGRLGGTSPSRSRSVSRSRKATVETRETRRKAKRRSERKRKRRGLRSGFCECGACQQMVVSQAMGNRPEPSLPGHQWFDLYSGPSPTLNR